MEIEKNLASFPNYALLEDRINSFRKKGWPQQLVQHPIELARAGFFYSGLSDGVICYQCGIGLSQWTITDVPFEEHAKMYPKCYYLKLVKGPEYIKSIKSKRLPFQKAIEREPLPDVEISQGKECLICTTTERQIAFQPCGHFATCALCSLNITKCCICRKTVENRLRIFSP